MNKQLKYFQEEVIARLDIIALILVFGLGFSTLVCWLVGIATIAQFIYAMYWGYKFRKDQP